MHKLARRFVRWYSRRYLPQPADVRISAPFAMSVASPDFDSGFVVNLLPGDTLDVGLRVMGDVATLVIRRQGL